MLVLAQQGAEVVAPNIEWSMMAPLVILSVGAILLITITSVVPKTRSGGFPAAFTITTAAVAGWFLKPMWFNLTAEAIESQSLRRQWIIGQSMMIDGFTIWVWAVILLAVFLCGGLLDSYLRREGFDGPEWYALMMISASGGMLLAASYDLILMFLAIEVLSIAVYVLTGLHLRRINSQEAAFKYFILGAMASAFLLFGIAMVYGATGSTNLFEIFATRSDNAAGLNPLQQSSLILVGMAMILIGFGFKVSAVPFHWWTPDVYEGAPTPVTAFMASAVKAAGFAGMLRVFWEGFGIYVDDWRPVISALAVASLLLGSFMALAQRDIKRMLAYSSIVHAGFILVALYAVPGRTLGLSDESFLGVQAFLFYLLAYSLMSIGSFGVLTVANGKGDHDASLDRYRGLAHTRPALAAMFAVLLFAQAGVPFTVGFVAKFRVIMAAAANGSYILAAIAMLASVVGAVLYLRVVVVMYMKDSTMVVHAATETLELDAERAVVEEAEEAAASSDPEVDPELDGHLIPAGLSPVPKAALLVVGITAVATLVLGVYPDLAKDVLNDAAFSLSSIMG